LEGDLAAHHIALAEFGIEFHTLQRTPKGTTLWVFQQEADPALTLKIQQYARINSGQIKTWAGDGDFIGSWTTRAEGARAYHKELNAYMERHPEKREAIDGIIKDWRRRAGTP
jgi:hypothetical protein